MNITIDPNLPNIYGDRKRIREVIENLIENAIKYSSDQKQPSIEIGIRDDRTHAAFFIKDNGVGIESQYQTKIFRLFEKLNPTSEGTGVGLALVKRIIDTLGGEIWVELDGLGKGSTFYFTLPDSRK